MSTDAAVIAWEEPPPRRGGPSLDPVEQNIAAELCKHAGHWAVVATYNSHHEATLLQRRIRRGSPGSVWSTGFEAVVRKHEGGWRVYARANAGSEVRT